MKKLRRALGLLRPIFLFTLPLWLWRIPVPLCWVSVTGGVIAEQFRFPVFAPYVFTSSFSVALAGIVSLQLFFTLARLSSLDDGLAERRRKLGRAGLALTTLGAMTYLATQFFLTYYQLRFHVADVPVPPIVTVDAVTVGVGFLALEGSRRGPWSCLIALFAGCTLMHRIWGLESAVAMDVITAGHAMDAFIAALALGVVAVAAVLVCAKRGLVRPRFRMADMSYLPFVLCGLVALLAGVYGVILDLDHEGLSPSTLEALGDAVLMGVGVAVARWIDPEPRTLARAGLGALFRREELALLPFAFASLAERLIDLRLFAAARSDDVFLNPTTAEQLSRSNVRVLLPYAVGLLVVVALRPYLKWIERLPAAEA